ncbi:MAG: phenylacetate--CoA ligase family protein, partial [Deltaproteobacteria bacterium]
TAILKFSPRVTGHFRILLDKPGPLVQPPLNIRIEYGVGVKEKDLSALEQEMTRYFREEIRVTPKFQWVPPETLPREKKKTRYIEVRGKS